MALAFDMERKFLTVMAVLDDSTQRLLGNIQSQIIAEAGEGTQTMGIPFHVTLGSYSTDCENAVVEKIRCVAANTYVFPINLFGYNHFVCC